MPRVIFLSSQDPFGELGPTVLYRSDVERAVVADPGAVVATARARLPNLVLIKDQPLAAAERLVRELKQTPETRRASVVVLVRGDENGAEMALRRAGASLVLTPPVEPLLWDDRLEELFSEPRRRDLTIPARFVIWPPHSLEIPQPATALNLSVRGALLETDRELDVGATVEVSLDLPEAGEADVVGQIVRDAEAAAGQRRYGVDFIILRGQSRARIEAFVESEARL